MTTAIATLTPVKNKSIFYPGRILPLSRFVLFSVPDLAQAKYVTTATNFNCKYEKQAALRPFLQNKY